MGFREFLKFLILSILLSIGVSFLLNLALPIAEHFKLLWWSIACFVSLALLAYWIANRSIKKNNGAQFIGLVMLNVFIKLVASFALVAAYVKLNPPDSKYFILPFIATYLIFTILETYFLSVQAREVK